MQQQSLPVVETFESVQGEGQWAGCYATFIRLAGCPVRCEFCDSRNAWKDAPKRRIDELSRCVQTERVVLTGGEPLVHAAGFWLLYSTLLKAGHFVEVETSGYLAWPYPEHRNYLRERRWVTVSPKEKVGYAVHPSIVDVVDAYKFVVTPNFAPAFVPTGHPVFLQPLWGDLVMVDKTLGILKDYQQWRLSVQTHKWLNLR